MRDAERKLFRSKAEELIKQDADNAALLCCQGCGVILTYRPLGDYLKCHCGHETHWSEFQAGFLHGLHAMFDRMKAPYRGCS